MARFGRRLRGLGGNAVAAHGVTVLAGSDVVLRDVSVRVDVGDVVGVFSRQGNEVGLEALAGVLAGDATASQGMVALDGTRVLRVPVPRGFGPLGATPLLTTALGLPSTATVRDVVRAAVGGVAGPRVVEVLGAAGLEELVDVAYESSREAWVLTAVAVALLRDENVWVLDMPTAGLDTWATARVMAVLRRLARRDDGAPARAVFFTAVSMCDACHGGRVLELLGDGTLVTFSDLSVRRSG